MPLTIRVPLLLGSISRQIYKTYVCIPNHAYIYNSTAGSVPSVYIPSSGLAGSKGKYVYRFLGISLQRNYTQFAFSSSCMKAVAFPVSSTSKTCFLFFFFSIYFYKLEANYFTTFQWVLSYIDMNQPWSYMYSPSRSPLPLPSPPDSSGSSQCTRPEHLSHASSLGW